MLPDDRTTYGYWPMGYGSVRYVLCAQNYVLDREGGEPDPGWCSFATTDPVERGRRWVSATQDDDPAAVWDPVHRTPVPANWDDFGEQYALGRGPDLLVRTRVPDGAHLLSLYFVNDHNYYEPGRRYSISVADGSGRLQGVTAVEAFGAGV